MKASARVLRWLFAPSRRRWTVGVTAFVAVVAVFATVTLTPPEDELTERVADAVVRPDPVPDGPIVTSIPPDCGLSLETLDDLVPWTEGTETTMGADEQRCDWDDLGERTLDVAVVKAHESVASRERVRLAAQVFDSSIDTTTTGDATSATDLRPVEGLGTRAVSWGTEGSGEAHGHVRFWQGNVAVEVDYGGESTSVDAAGAGALRAAAEVARSMELTAARPPEVGTAADRAVESVPAACALLPDRVVAGIVSDDEGTAEESYLFGDAEDGACHWWGSLEVEVAAAPRSEPGTGEQAAARRYLATYLEARSGASDTLVGDGEDAERYTAPLHGLGDEAYAHWQRDATSAEGVVVFRLRDVLVRITVEGVVNERPTRPALLDAAYGAALAAARNLRG